MRNNLNYLGMILFNGSVIFSSFHWGMAFENIPIITWALGAIGLVLLWLSYVMLWIQIRRESRKFNDWLEELELKEQVVRSLDWQTALRGK